ncbi:MAG: efflux RND transporter periplasmic adaptor subunit [Chloroflexota bacterium]
MGLTLKNKLTAFFSANNDRLKRNAFLSKNKIWFAIVVVALLAGGGGYLYYRFGYLPGQASDTATMQTAVARQGDLVLYASGTGTLIPADEVSFGFETSGEVSEVLVSVGDEVEAGQLLARLDDTDAQAQLTEAKQTLAELTSAQAIAKAELAVATAEADVIDAQITLNNLQYWKNDALIQNMYAALVIAKDKLDQAQEDYDRANVGEYINDATEARLYQALYNAQQAYDTAMFYYNLYSQKPTQRAIDEAEANLALAEATLDEAKIYLAALTSGEIPEDATGSSLQQLRQAQLNVQEAEDVLEATNLYAPISGTIMSLNIGVGDQAGTGNIITIDDLSTPHLDVYLDESDWDKIQVGYAVEVTFDAQPDTIYSGTVVEVDPGLYTQGMTSAVHGVVELDPPEGEFSLLVGMSAAVDVISGQAENALLIPIEALHEITAGQYAVFVVENGKPVMRVVEVGIQDSYYAEIKSGLQAGEVVTTGIVETK